MAQEQGKHMNVEPKKALKAYEIRIAGKSACCIAMTIMLGMCAMHFDSKWLLMTMSVPILMYFSY